MSQTSEPVGASDSRSAVRPTPQLDRLRQRGLIRAIDRQFGRFMGQHQAAPGESIELAAALLSLRMGEGHVCIDLAGESAAADWLRAAGIEPPMLDDWRQALAASPCVALADASPAIAFRPLVLDRHDRLYTHKHWQWETQVRDQLLQLAETPTPIAAPDRIAQALGELLGDPPDTPDQQRIAVANACLSPLCLISGGPGTGKTTTVVRILALLQTLSDPPLRIALAAPTGKAAVRLQESIRRQKNHLPEALGVRVPDAVTTLHKLLGARPDSTRYRHHRENPLSCQLLVVDEASMIDLALMARLLDALPADARLILLGDRDQLASVEAGAVLGELCEGGDGFSDQRLEQLRRTAGQTPPAPTNPPGSRLADCLVTLDRSYRFDQQQGIGQLARAVRDGQVTDAIGLLEDPAQTRIERLEAADGVEQAIQGYGDLFRLLGDHATDGSTGDLTGIFEAFARFRCLSVLREGERGVSGLNRAVETGLRRLGLIRGEGAYYAGRPVMVTRNDPGLHLSNGDVGLLLPDDQGQLRACFLREDGQPIQLAPGRLPPHETAFVLTVHKSQGSEFARVLLIAPDQDNPLLTRELLYTALTRATTHFTLAAPRELLPNWIRRRVERSSGLAERLAPNAT